MPTIPSPPDPIRPVAEEIAGSLGLTIDGLAGRGAFKHVYRASSSAGPFALKVVSAVGASLRTEREIAVISRCNHPNICQLIAAGVSDTASGQYAYLLEEFLSGGSLEDRLRSVGQLDNNQTRSIALSISSALAHLHEKRLVHRDIKPANVMFRNNGWDPVLVDFGLVRDLAASSLTATWAGQGPGTPFFSSPEQLTNDKALIDWRSDQFSLGVTISLGRFGKHPFHKEGEALDHSRIVNRVAARESAAPWLERDCVAQGLAAIPQMLMPWPFQRFCLVSSLLAAWA